MNDGVCSGVGSGDVDEVEARGGGATVLVLVFRLDIVDIVDV